MNTTQTHEARSEEIAALWVKYPQRAVTHSTGIVHVWHPLGRTLCSTKNASRGNVADSSTPTCRMCGADEIKGA